MAEAFQKRRAGLVAILKHSLTTMAPVLYNKGLLTDKEREAAMDESASKWERAEGLVSGLGTKIQRNEKTLKEFLEILQEARVAHTYVVIMNNELGSLQRERVNESVRKNAEAAEAKSDEDHPSKWRIVQTDSLEPEPSRREDEAEGTSQVERQEA